MEKQELGGHIVLENFDLDSQEMVVIRKIVGKYGEKIRHFTEYDELRAEMKSHLKAKNRRFEVKVFVSFDGEKAVATGQGFNVFVLIDNILKKILSEVEHKVKKGFNNR